MIIIQDYNTAILLAVLAMVCWGSWANTRKFTGEKWRFELYYWDFVAGLVLAAVAAAFTVGSMGTEGRPFVKDLMQADFNSILFAFAGGVVWNIGNLLLVAAITIAGMAVAFPIGGGIAWILGIVINYVLILLSGKQGIDKPIALWAGVACIVISIIISGKIYGLKSKSVNQSSLKGIVISVSAGLFIAFFYGFVVKGLDAAFVDGGTGALTPFTGIVMFSLGVLISTIILNPVLMKRPFSGPPISMRNYKQGSVIQHISGVSGGLIWMTGMVVSLMAAGVANPAIAYALSNAAPVIAMIWGIFIWKEFKGMPTGAGTLITIMFIGYLAGLALITYSNA